MRNDESHIYAFDLFAGNEETLSTRKPLILTKYETHFVSDFVQGVPVLMLLKYRINFFHFRLSASLSFINSLYTYGDK